MVNKVALGILLVIMLAAVTIGALVGLQLGGGGGLAPAGTSTPTPTPAPTAAPATAATPTATPTPRPTATPTDRPTATPFSRIPPEEFDEREIAAAVVARLNEFRAGRDEAELDDRESLAELARFHSENMAVQGYASHVANGYTAEERYERFDLGNCRVTDDSNTGIRSGADLETVAKTFAGRPYEDGDVTRVNENEEQIARQAFEDWMASEDARRTLTLDGARAVGVGTNVTDDGAVYVTVNLC